MIFNFFSSKNSNDEENAYKSVEKVEDFTNHQQIADYFKNHTGVTFENKSSILQNKLKTFCRQREIYSFDDLLKVIKSNDETKQELVNYLTTNESFFYREFNQIKELIEKVKNSNNPNNTILCAPSATGEEPYSIVIALLEANIPSNNFKITGIDINSNAIKTAKEGLYSQRSIKNIPENIVDKYFDKENDKYRLKNLVKEKVDFKLTNIFDASFKSIGKFDYIFSRNMLIYFDKETKLKAKEILESLRKDESIDVFFGHADLF